MEKKNKDGIWAIVFSLISLVIFGWLSIAGVGMAISGLKKAKAGEGGKVTSIIGLIISIIALALYLYLVMFM